MNACRQCRYCKRKGDTPYSWLCKKTKQDVQLSDALALVVGKRTHVIPCAVARKDETQCGVDARWFKRRWF